MQRALLLLLLALFASSAQATTPQINVGLCSIILRPRTACSAHTQYR